MAALVLTFLLFCGAFISVLGCQDGQRRLIKGTACSMYEECYSGVYIVMLCNPGEIFDSEALACRPRTEKACVDHEEECDSSVFYSHPDSCRLYYKCNGNRMVTKLCPIGQAYDPSIRSCRHGYPCSQTGCLEGMKRPVNGESSQYEKCENGKWVKKVCQKESIFDLESLSCSSELESDRCTEGETMPLDCEQYMSCKDGSWLQSSCALGEVYDEDMGGCKIGTCKARSKRNAKLCEAGRKRRVEGSCKEYTECENGEEVKKTCSPCMNFDDVLLTCRYVFSSPCPNPPPPVPTDPPTPEPTTAAPTTAAPTTAAPTTAEPTTAAPTTAGPTTAEPTTAEPTTAAPTTAAPTTAGPTTAEPTTAAPTTAAPTTAEPITPIPTASEPPTTIPPAPSSSTPEATSTTSTAPSSTVDPKPKPNSRPTIPPNPSPKCTDGERKIIPGDCKNYLVCMYGKYYTDRCNYFQHFDKETMDCRVFGYTCP